MHTAAAWEKSLGSRADRLGPPWEQPHVPLVRRCQTNRWAPCVVVDTPKWGLARHSGCSDTRAVTRGTLAAMLAVIALAPMTAAYAAAQSALDTMLTTSPPRVTATWTQSFEF